MAEKVRVGVIGCGKISGAYLGMAKNFPVVEMAACADLNEEAAKAKAAEYGIPKVCSVDEIIKDPSLRMTSCSAQITCDKTNPNYYDLTVNWDVRLTWSGTFVHSAPWSVDNQGFANVSHGCVNLSQAHGQAFFEQSRYGDVVVVKNSSRPATDLVQSGDPGMADWNMSWSAYVAASALKQPVTTTPLPAQQG